MKEIFKDIHWLDWLYQVSNLWRIKSLNFNRSWKEWFLSVNLIWKTPMISISQVKIAKWKFTSCSIARLVAQHFIPNPDNLPYALFKIENKDPLLTDYSVNNIYWGTAKNRKWIINSNPLNKKQINALTDKIYKLVTWSYKKSDIEKAIKELE